MFLLSAKDLNFDALNDIVGKAKTTAYLRLPRTTLYCCRFKFQIYHDKRNTGKCA